MTSILVIDDHKLVAEGTKNILIEEGFEAEVLFSAKSLSGFLNHRMFDVYLVDWNLPGINGMAVAETILKADRGAKIVIYTGYEAEMPAVLDELVARGINAVISKEANVATLIASIRVVLSGYDVFPHSVSRKAVERRQLIKNTETSFDEREREIMKAVIAGKTNKAIAIQLHISQRTTEYLLKNIFTKLAIKSREEIEQTVHQRGIILK